jgi:hypothetical protein
MAESLQTGWHLPVAPFEPLRGFRGGFTMYPKHAHLSSAATGGPVGAVVGREDKVQALAHYRQSFRAEM